MINRIVGHWKGGGITLEAIPTTKPIFFPSSFSWWLRGFPWKLPVAGSIPWNSQRYMESIESSSNAEPVSSANRSGGEGWYNVRKLHRKDLGAIFQQKIYLYFGFAWIFFFDIRLSRALFSLKTLKLYRQEGLEMQALLDGVANSLREDPGDTRVAWCTSLVLL